MPPIVSVPVPAFVNVWLFPLARRLPVIPASPKAVSVSVRAPAVSVSLQILPVIVTVPLALKVSPSLLAPAMLPEVEAKLKP